MLQVSSTQNCWVLASAPSGAWSLQPRRLPPCQEPVPAAAVVSILCVPSSCPSSDHTLPVLVLLPPICLAFSLISPPPTHSLSSHRVQPTSGCGWPGTLGPFGALSAGLCQVGLGKSSRRQWWRLGQAKTGWDCALFVFSWGHKPRTAHCPIPPGAAFGSDGQEGTVSPLRLWNHLVWLWASVSLSAPLGARSWGTWSHPPRVS